MNNTATYINDLLYRYECVILPGFGAFLTKRQPAMIQPATHAFFPPQKLISFNSQLRNNDGLLANYIASVEDISYTDALAKIQRYVLYVQSTLDQQKKIELSGIGSLYTSVEDTLQFEPSEKTNYLTEAFGLNSFISPSIERKEEITREVLKKEVEILEEKTPIAFTPEKRASKSYLQYAATAAIIIGLAGLLGYGALSIRNDQVVSENSAYKNYKMPQEIDSMIQEATFEISNPLPAINLTVLTEEEEKSTITNNTSSTGNTYHIVAGAFRIERNAIKKVQKLKTKGFNARLIGVNKYGLHQVVYDSYPNRQAALKALQEIKKQQDRRAWLFIEK